MIFVLVLSAVLAIAAGTAFVRGMWRRGLYWATASVVLLGAVVGYLLSWNAVMLKVQHDATTRGGR